MYNFLQQSLPADDREIDDHDQAQDDPVPSEDLKVVRTDIIHKKTDDQYGYDKGDDHADCQNCHFHAGKSQSVFDDLEKAGAEHDRDRQNKCEARRHSPGNADHDPAQDRRAGSGCSRKDRCDQLKQSYDERLAVCQVPKPPGNRFFAVVAVFHHNKGNAHRQTS